VVKKAAIRAAAALRDTGATDAQVEAMLAGLGFDRTVLDERKKGEGPARTVATQADVKNAAPGVYRVANAQRLYLKKTARDAGSYFLRYRCNGRRPEMGLGPIDLGRGDSKGLTIQKARELAAFTAGSDPLAERRRAVIDARVAAEAAAHVAAIPTVARAVEAYVANHAADWRGARAVQDWLNPIKTHAYPVVIKAEKGKLEKDTEFGKLKVDAVEAKHIAAVVKAIKGKGHATTGRKVHANLRAVFDAEIALGHRDAALGNPAAKGTVNAITPAVKHVTGHYRRIELDTAPDVFQKLVAAAPDNIGIAAWVFMALTAARPSEVREARWDQVDLERKIWRNPALKARERDNPLPVPLSPIALEILEAQKRMADGRSDFIFPGRNGAAIPIDTLADAPLKKVAVDAGSPHSWRSIFRDAAEDRCGFSDKTAEYALAHSLGKVEKAYRRETAIEARCLLMAAYEDWLMGKTSTAGNVVVFAGRKG
jgi:integrase